MRGETRIAGGLILVWLAALFGTTGCLPAGGPPTGQRWLSGRTLVGFVLQFVPDAAGAAPSILVTDGDPATELDLYHVVDPGPAVPSAAAPTAAQAGKLLLSNYSWQSGSCSPSGCRPVQDAEGRLLAAQVPSDAGYGRSSDSEFFRIDLTTDAATDLGPESSFTTSASGQRVLLLEGYPQSATLYESDGRQTALTNVSSASFAGEDLYWLELADPTYFNSATLHRFPADGPDQTISQSVATLEVISVGGGPLIFLGRFDAAGNGSSSILDPTTLAEMPVPDDGTYRSGSSDGSWVQLWTFPGGSEPVQNELFDVSTGTTQPIGEANQGSWRPGHDDFWMVPYSAYGTDVQIWQAGIGMTTTTINASLATYNRVGDNSGGSPFTPDGRHWFSFVIDNADRGQMFVGPADDLTAPTFPVNPPGTGPGQYWQLADGRLLVEAYVSDSQRNDIYLVDPDTGQTRELGTGGHVVMAGRTRALALLDWVSSADNGNLTLIDFDTGATTLLGENVSGAALQGPADPTDPSADPLAPGLEVAFLVRNLLDSPYDGLWVTTLP